MKIAIIKNMCFIFMSLNLKKKANHIFFIVNFSKLFINIYYGYYENCFFLNIL